jgi:hypothetical protein
MLIIVLILHIFIKAYGSNYFYSVDIIVLFNQQSARLQICKLFQEMQSNVLLLFFIWQVEKACSCFFLVFIPFFRKLRGGLQLHQQLFVNRKQEN